MGRIYSFIRFALMGVSIEEPNEGQSAKYVLGEGTKNLAPFPFT
jgi:hypothetical protein